MRLLIAAGLLFAVSGEAPADTAPARTVEDLVGRIYEIETPAERYRARLDPEGAYNDTRPREGVWSFDGRTLCVRIFPFHAGETEFERCKPYPNLTVGESVDMDRFARNGDPARITRVR